MVYINPLLSLLDPRLAEPVVCRYSTLISEVVSFVAGPLCNYEGRNMYTSDLSLPTLSLSPS